MKKIILVIVVFMCGIFPVFASDNKLFLTMKDNKIYYDQDLYNKDLFMTHVDMLPGQSFTDELKIQNGTGIPLTLYLKVKEKEQSIEANELLDNILMKIYFNNQVIYDGKVKGLDYKSNGVNLQDAVLLKNFEINESADIKVELKLSSEYSNKDFNDYSYLDWVFYAQFEPTENKPEEPKEEVVVEVVEAPKTGLNYNYVPVVISSVGLCIVGCIIILLAKKKKEEENKK